jgi:tetratricopeptide (TPR) repeat protein
MGKTGKEMMIPNSRFQIPDYGLWISDFKLGARNPYAAFQSGIWNLESGIKTLLALLSLLAIALNAWGQDVQVTASVSSDTVGIQDQFQVSVTVTGKDSGDAENPRFSRMQGFKVVSGPSIGTQFQWVNGKSSSSKSFVYILIPEKEGQFTIDPVEVRVGGKIFKTQPLQVRVTSAPSNPPPAPQRQRPFAPFDPFDDETAPSRRPAGDSVFIRAELDRTSAYPGQQVTLIYKLYTQVSVNGIQLQENPPLSGFWIEDLQVDPKPKAERLVVKGREYQAFVIKKQALFATTTGKLKIPSCTFAISAGIGGDIFGIFSQTETLYRKTDEIALDVKPLPTTDRPADFHNAVGSFTLTASMDKNQVATGDAVALRVKLEGRGNLKTIPDISIPALPDFTIYSSKRADASRSFAGDQVGGDKTWEYVIVPKAPGRQTIPSLSFSFFDPERDKYETVTTPALSLNVTRGADNATAVSGLSGSDKQNLVRRGTDINFIKLAAGDLKQQSKPLYRMPWFCFLAAIPIAFNVGVFLYRKRRSKYAEDRILVRNRKARRTALERLKAAEKKSKSDARLFYDQAAAALSGYLVDKFGLAEIDLTGDKLERALTEKSVPPQAVEETRACLQECDFGRFVSASASAEKNSALSARIRKSIEALENSGKIALILLAALVLVSSSNLSAAPNQESPAMLFARGNAEYQKGNYESAERCYSEILHSGIDSGALYCNLGNACFKQKRLGDAIYYWEKALQLIPHDREIQENLELANLLIIDRIENSPDPFPLRILMRIVNFMSISQETWLVLALLISANIFLSLYLLAKNPRNSFRALVACIGLGLLFVIFVCSLSWKIYDQDFRQKGIVVEQKVDVRSGPGAENIAVFTIHEGIKVRVHGIANGWYQISLPNGWSGWLPQNDIRIL